MARHDGIILVKQAGQLVPDAAFEKMLSVSSAPWGCAFAADGVLQAQWEKDPNTLKGLKDIQEAYKDQQLVYFFGRYPNNFDEDDLQPYIIQADDQDNPRIFAFIEGMFDRHSPDGPMRADAYYAIENVVVPQVQQLYEVFNGDIAKVMDALDKPTPHRLLSTLCNDNGCGTLVLLANTGQLKTFSKNQAWKEFEWGKLSQSHGYAEGTFPEKAAEGNTGFSSKRPSKIKRPSAEEPAKEEPKEVVEKPPVENPEIKKVGDTTIHLPPKQPAQPITDTAVQPDKSILVKVKMPANLTNKEAKKWIYNRIGTVPEGREDGWRTIKTRGFLMVPALNVKKDDTIMEAVGTPQKATVTAKSFEEAQKILEQRADKNVEPEHVQPPNDVVVVSAKEKRDFETKFLQSDSVKRSLEGKRAPQTLAEIQAIEDKYASFSENTSRHLEETFRYSPEDIMVLVLNYPGLTRSLILSLRNSLMKMLAEELSEQEETADTAPRKSRLKRA